MENKEKNFNFIKEFLDSISNLSEDDLMFEKKAKHSRNIDEIVEKYNTKVNITKDCLDDVVDSVNLFIEPIEKLKKKSKYPISEYQAFQIANENRNLKSDYCKIISKQITYLDFTDCKIKLVTKNKEKYWKIKITKGKISWVEFDNDNLDEFTEPIFCDGFLTKDDFKKLQCLINVNTGEYIYISNKKSDCF